MDKKYALVTGASSGIGWEFSMQLARKGYNLIISSRRLERLQKLKSRVKDETNVMVEIIEADLSTITGARRVVDYIKKRNLDVEYLVNNAGYGYYGNFSEKPWPFWSEMINVNVNSVVFLTSQILGQMKRANRGNILFVSSVGGFMPVPLFSVYAASKAFVLHFAEGLAEELSGTGIRVSVLCPGPTATEFFDVASEGAGVRQKNGFADPVSVVIAGLRGLEKGKRVIVPGFLNRAQVFFTRLTGRRMVAKAAGLVMRRNRLKP